MNPRLLVTALAFSSMSALALAQVTTPSTAPATSGTTTAPATAGQAAGAGGLRIANTASMAVKFTTVKPADIMSSKLVGVNVYNNQNENVGEIEDLVIDNGKTITGLVVSVGGFLGMGESYVVLDPSTVLLSEKDGTWKAFIDSSKESLKGAPKFKYSKK